MNIGALTVTLNADTSGLIQARIAMLSFEKSTITSLNAMSQRFRTFGYLATSVITLPLAMAGKAAFNAAKNFEFSMQKIVGLAGVAQSEVNAWGKSVFEISKAFGKSPQELAEALYFIASSGIKGSQALEVLNMSAKAAASGLGETQDVANLLTSVLNAYAGTGLTAAYATDVLVAAVREGKAEATGFASAIGQVIPIAALMGVSFDQVAGAMAAMTLAGASASNAAFYLKGFLSSLLKGKDETGQAAEALKILKTSYSELRKILREEGLLAVMKKINDLTAQYGETLVGKVLPNIRGLTAQLSIAGKNFEYNSALMKRVTESAGSLRVAWAAVADTIKIRYDRAIAAAQVSMIALGTTVATTFLPILESLVGKLDRVIKWFDSLTEAQKRHKIVMLMVIAALGPLSLMIATIGYTVSGLMVIWNKLIWVLNILKIAFATNPIASLIMLVSTLAAGYLLLKNRIRDTADEQSRLNKLMEESGKLKEAKVSIKERMSVIWAMDPKQLESFKNEIGAEKLLQQDYLVNLEFFRKSWYETDLQYINAQKMLAFAEDQLREWRNKKIGERDAVQVSRWADDVKNRYKYLKDVIRWHEAYVNEQVRITKDTIVEYDKSVKEIDAITDPILKNIAKVEKEVKDLLEAQADITKVFDNLAAGELLISRMSKLMGSEFDIAGEKTKLYNKILGDLAETTIPLTDKRIQGLIETLWKLQMAQPMKKIKMPLDIPDLTKEMDLTKKIFGLYGDISKANQLIKPKAFLDIDKTQATYATILESWNAKGLISEREFLDSKYAMDIASTLAGTNARMQIETQYSKDVRALRIADIQSYLTSASTAINTISSLIEASKQKELSAAGDSAVRRERIERNYLKKQKAWAIAQAIINGALGITNILATVPLGVLNPAAWVAMAVTAASTAAQVAIISGQNLAKGGIIPPGYPKDSYPAMLTSGETVIPPKALSSLQRQSSAVEMLKDVRFHIEGTSLVGVFENHNRKVKSYS